MAGRGERGDDNGNRFRTPGADASGVGLAMNPAVIPVLIPGPSASAMATRPNPRFAHSWVAVAPPSGDDGA